MAWDYSTTIAASIEEVRAEQVKAMGDLEGAHLNEDAAGFYAARDRLYEADKKAEWILQKANQLQRQHQHAQAAPANKFGLSRGEQEVAELSFVPRRDLPNLTTEQKHQMYAYHKARYARMRQTGEYSDSQGRQREKF